VLQYRLTSEYGADSRLESAPWTVVRWIEQKSGASAVDESMLPSRCRLAEDSTGAKVILFVEQWANDLFAREHPEVTLLKQPAQPSTLAAGERARGVG
jgi:peptide chain release factor 3